MHLQLIIEPDIMDDPLAIIIDEVAPAPAAEVILAMMELSDPEGSSAVRELASDETSEESTADADGPALATSEARDETALATSIEADPEGSELSDGLLSSLPSAGRQLEKTADIGMTWMEKVHGAQYRTLGLTLSDHRHSDQERSNEEKSGSHRCMDDECHECH